MEAVDGVGLPVPVTFFIMLAIESRWPARAFPPRRGWRAPMSMRPSMARAAAAPNRCAAPLRDDSALRRLTPRQGRERPAATVAA